MPGGHVASRRLDILTDKYTSDGAHWSTQVATVRRVETTLRDALVAADDEDVWMRDYLHEWGDQVGRLDTTEVPINIRGNSPRLDDRLGDTAFAFYDGIPVTPPLKRPPAQDSDFEPRCIGDLLYPWAIERIDWWMRSYHEELERFANFKWPTWCVEQTERDDYIRGIRQFNEHLVLGQNAFRPRARGKIWDLRDLDNIKLLDYNTPLESHFDLQFLRELLDTCRDRDMVSQVTDTGANFGADVALQIYFAPHLTTLAPGYELVSKELKRLAGAGYLEFISYLGFFPCRFIQQGTRARKLEPDRPRRISDAGTPRTPKADSLGVGVMPLNEAIKRIPESENPSDTSYQFGNDTERTTGVLGSSGLLPPSPSTRVRKRLPWEAKPHVPDVLHDIMVLLYMARTFKLDLYIITDDWKDMFNQFKLAPWELWKVGFAFAHISDVVGDKTTMGIILEYTLGYGFANASNLCQRFANGVFEAIATQMHDADREFFASPDRTPEERALIARRRKLSVMTGRDECALFSMCIYTDDGLMIVAGVERALRLLRLWGGFVRRSRARMAIPEKRTLGAGLLWCGVHLLPCLGMAYVPRGKVVRACTALERVARADSTLEWGEYRSLVGLLEHLLPIVGFNRRQMHELYYPHHIFDNAAPAAQLRHSFTDGMMDRAREWIDRLATCPGALADAVFGAQRTAVPADVVQWYIFGDAAREQSTSDSGLGGYMHGYAWRAPLDMGDISGPFKLPITVLEYIVIAVNLMVFSSLIPNHESNWPTIASDSLGSFLAVLDLKSKSPLMQFVTNYIAAMPEVARFRHRLEIAHVYGTGNVYADAESRGKNELIEQLNKQLKVEYKPLPLPKRAVEFINDVRACARRHASRRPRGHQRQGRRRDRQQRSQQPSRHGSQGAREARSSAVRQRPSSPAERGTTAANSSSSMGDGPGAGSRPLTSLPQGHNARRAEPERPRRITELAYTDFVVGARDRIFVVVTTDAPVEAEALWRPAYDDVLAELLQAAHGASRQRPSSPSERGTNAATSSSSMGDGPGVDGESPLRFAPPAASATPPLPSRQLPLAASSPSPRTPVPAPQPTALTSRLCMPPPPMSPDVTSSAPTAPSVAPAPAPRARAPAPRAAPAPAPAAQRSSRDRRRDMADFDPTMAPTFEALRNELATDKSPYRIGLVDEGLLADVFRTYADSAATRTIGADRSAWRKWKAFCARHHIERLWRNDVASNSGADARGHRREVYILRAFLIETHRMMAPRRRRKKRAKPRSALNVVAGVRRIHKRAMIDMVSCGHLAMALRGLNSQFLREEGSNKALLEERAEPLNNVECASMIGIDNGTPLRGWTVDWLSVEGLSFKAGLLTARQSGTRKADIASLDEEREPHEMAKDNLTWYLSDGVGGYRHVPELPPAHALVDGECACLRPAASKADQTAEQFGNQLIYLPVIHSDVNNAALALAELERVHVVHGNDRQHAPLLVANESGLALTCGRIDRIFTALARAALGDALASKRSFHSCRVFAACCHKAHGEDDAVIQALCRWRSPESLRIYARINPRDYAARVRRMSSTTVDSTLAANLPTLDDRALHADFANVIGPLEQGRDIADTCPVDESDDEDDEAAASSGAAGSSGGAKRRPAPARSPAAHTPAAPSAKRHRPAQPASSSTPVERKQRRVTGTTPISLQQNNPKRTGSSAHKRYELYKRAKTRDEFKSLGGCSADFAQDLRKGYVVLS
mgnify:FL=1